MWLVVLQPWVPAEAQFCSNFAAIVSLKSPVWFVETLIFCQVENYIRPTGQPIMSRRFQGGAFEFSRTLWSCRWPMGHGASDVVNNGKTSSNQHRDSECSSECVGPRAPIRTSPKRCLTAAMDWGFQCPLSSCFEACGDRWEVALLLFDEAKVLMQTATKGQKGSISNVFTDVYGIWQTRFNIHTYLPPGNLT